MVVHQCRVAGKKRKLYTVVSAVGVLVAGTATFSHHRMPEAGPKAVCYAHAFQATDMTGKSVTVSPGADGRCLLLFFCLCQDCQTFARQTHLWIPLRGTVPTQVVGIVHANLGQARSFRAMTRFPGRILSDPSGNVHDQYRVGLCPNAWLVNRDGSVHFSRREPVAPRVLIDTMVAWPADR